jgi:eukaryotic-like serine/threonine-protein kinase
MTPQRPQGPTVGPATEPPLKDGTDPMIKPVENCGDPAAEKMLEATSGFTQDATRDSGDMGAHIDEQLIGESLDFYHVFSLLGCGAMGRVYRAWNERLHRVCALKIIDPDLVRAEPERLEMFLREARAAAQLVHPHIVTIHLLGQAKGFHFIEMEFINGMPLSQHVKEAGKLDPLHATRFVRQIGSALSAAHACGLIHCDVKPDNVMLTSDKQAKLGDFGLARVFGRGTGSVKTVGTPYYMAPELFSGKEASVASDCYALGVSYYFLLTGRLPLQARTMSELQKKLLFDESPRVDIVAPETPPAIATLVSSMISKDPTDRPAINHELLEELDRLLSELVSTEEIVAEAMEDTPVVWQHLGGDRFSFLVPLIEGRRQTILADVVPSAAADQPVMAFWTPCAPAKPEHYAYVLRLNARLPFGAVSIREYKGTPHFVVSSNHPRPTLDPEEIRSTVMEMAKWADFVEQRLTGEDKF